MKTKGDNKYSRAAWQNRNTVKISVSLEKKSTLKKIRTNKL